VHNYFQQERPMIEVASDSESYEETHSPSRKRRNRERNSGVP
jgi:hypothetical protein